MKHYFRLRLIVIISLACFCVGCSAQNTPDHSPNLGRAGTDGESASAADIQWRNVSAIAAVEFSDSVKVWAVTARDRKLIRSYDSGRTWTTVDEISNARLIDFVNENQGWLIAGDAQLYTTENGGGLWKPVSSRFRFSLPRKMQFVDQSSGFVWDENRLLATSDGGTTWSEVKKYQGKHEIASGDLDFLDARVGWLCDVGNIHGFTAGTEDSGKTWKKSDVEGAKAHPCEIMFANTQVGWVRFNQLLFKTGDGGKRWKQLRPGRDKFAIRSMFLLNSRIGFLAGYESDEPGKQAQHGRGSLLKTLDDGVTWTEVSVDTGVPFFDKILFFDQLIGCLTSRDSIYLTSDGGITWSKSFTVG